MFKNEGLKVGAASEPIKAEDTMVIGGGILPAYLSGQEGELRASAIIIEKNTKICIVSCDVLMTQRDILDDVCIKIKSEVNIPPENILIFCTHTHHAPTTITLHGYEREQLFCERLKDAILEAVKVANSDLKESQCYFEVGSECEVGQNSRLVLEDGSILWVPLEEEFASFESTGPFDSDLPVLAYKTKEEKLQAVIFNHSTHNIGSRENKRSPGFYGLAAQELESNLGGTILFAPGASGTTHNFRLSPAEMISLIKDSVNRTYLQAKQVSPDKILSIKKEFSYRIRHFNEAEEENNILYYSNKLKELELDWCEDPNDIIRVFREMRKALKEHQGEIRKSWLQAIVIGEIAFVAVPGELFGKLGRDIKQHSPFGNTYIIGYANDHIGYIPDKDAYKLGGYQIWTGLHSFVEKGFGESLVTDVLSMLKELRALSHKPAVSR